MSRIENFKDLKDYEGIYKIGDKGTLISNRTRRNFKVNRIGIIPKYDLYKFGKCKRVRVSRLVAETFLDNKENLRGILHKNGDVNDCRVENLKYVRNAYIKEKHNGTSH